LKHTDLDVDAGCLLHKLALLVKLGGFVPLLHKLANSRDLDDHRFICELIGNTEPSLDITHLNGRSRYTRIALRIVEFNVHFLVMVVFGVEQRFFIELLGLDCVALVLDLTRKLPTNVLLFLRCDLLAKLKSGKPVLKIHSHFKSQFRLATLQEVVLSNIMLE
jgi:hypothetical protein